MIVGMDFGTTNSGMAVYDGAQLHLLPLDPSNETAHVARTALYITNQKQVFLGRAAIEAYYAQNLNRPVKFESVWVGEVVMSYAELPDWVRDVYIEKDVLSPGRLFLSFKTGLSASHYFGTTVGTDFYFIEDITALYLYIARRRAERLLNQDLTRIVLGRPVRFSLDPQADTLAQQRLLHAAFRAGYEEVYLQYEPIAAAHFYETTLDREQRVLVFDFGGGTLDVSIVQIGNPQHRAILATGGIPVAGDVFDRKLVRAKLPAHFGENSTYRADNGKTRPVPSHYFDAFSDWQTLLELNTPSQMKTLERIARTATKKRQLRALVNLISSSYGLKIFDQVEAAKRELSDALHALIRLDGPGFQVREVITRAEFERLIDEDRAAIDTLLDDVLEQAELKPDQIDAVIRTGGSSEIPRFVDLLKGRFGPEKVQALDTFSSVTSGLGVIARDIEGSQIDAKAYHRDDWTYGGQLRTLSESGRAKNGVPAVDLDVVKRFVDLQETSEARDEPALGLVALTEQHGIQALLLPHIPSKGAGEPDALPLKGIHLDDCWPGGIIIAPSDERLLLMTSEYRFLVKTVRELAGMVSMGLRLSDTETMHSDAFGEEFVSGFQTLTALQQPGLLALISTTGHCKTLRADTLLPRLEQPIPFKLEALPGYPAALIPVDDASDLLIFNSAGNVLRLSGETLQNAGSRIMKIQSGERVSGALRADSPITLLLANNKGRGKLIASDQIAPAAPPASGKKIISRQFRALASERPDTQPWAITSTRMLPLRAPLNRDPGSTLRSLLRLKKGEILVGLHFL